VLVPALSRGGDGCECVRCVAGRRTVRRRQAHGLAQADAEALIRDHGATAYSEARERERGSAEGEIARRPELVLVTTATGQRK
jgi:hypothetical protein